MCLITKCAYKLIVSHPGLTAAQIANRLDLQRETLLKVLYEDLKGQVASDRAYGWWPADQVPTPTADGIAAPPVVGGQTPLLQRLLRYYAACVKRDRPYEIRFPLINEGHDFVVLPLLPLQGHAWADLPEDRVREAMEGRDAVVTEQELLHVGYPVRIEPDGGGNGLNIEPLFLFPVQRDVDGDFSVVVDALCVNEAILRREEANALLEELGLGIAEVSPPWDEVCRRLQGLYPEWVWREPLTAETLCSASSVRQLDRDGYYNRAILYVAPPPKYTRGLEKELERLKAMPQAQFGDCALKAWAEGKTESAESDDRPLIEVMPLNVEQRDAVRSGMTAPLTVITGPPGTGKSQVVASLIVNAVHRGQRVLFACRNNKPLDVVARRVNALSPAPLLQRVGKREHNPILAQFVNGLLTAAPNTQMAEQEKIFANRQCQFRAELARLQTALSEVVGLRNRAVEAARQAQAWQDLIPRTAWDALRGFDTDKWAAALRALDEATDAATREKQPFLSRLFWNVGIGNRLRRLEAAKGTVNEMSVRIGRPAINHAAAESNVSAIRIVASQLCASLPVLKQGKTALESWASLSRALRVEEAAAKETGLQSAILETSKDLWNCWLRLRPQRLSQTDRRSLSAFSSQLNLAANDRGFQAWGDYFRAYEAVARILPCAWGVTALTTQSMPMSQGLFDLLIMDEAAAADMASAVPLLYRCRRAVIIGDGNQMRHIVQLSAAQDRLLMSNQGLEGFENSYWSYVANPVFGVAATLVPQSQIHNLLDHHRSHRHIIEFANKHFYEGELRVVTRYDQLKGLQPGKAAVEWVDVRGLAVRPPSGSAVNETEAQRVADVVRGLGAECSIGVVAPFSKQVDRIKELLEHDRPDVLVGTAHTLQGDERDIIVFSPVVSAGMSKTGLDFLRTQFNVFNVAVTRARSRLIVVGDSAAAASSGVQYLAALADYVQVLQAEAARESRQEEEAGGVPAFWRTRAHTLEVSLCEALLGLGLGVRPELAVEQHVLQLALQGERFGTGGLDVEVDRADGEMWSNDSVRRLVLRDRRLMELGWKVMRFYAHEIEFELAGCVAQVRAAWETG